MAQDALEPEVANLQYPCLGTAPFVSALRPFPASTSFHLVSIANQIKSSVSSGASLAH